MKRIESKLIYMALMKEISVSVVGVSRIQTKEGLLTS